jgi:nucleoside 2-deoxyribosyltransferase
MRENLNKKILYVGCALTDATESFKAEVEALKTELKRDWQVLDFLGLVDGTAADVYRHDIVENIGTCDGFIAITDHPSTGLGWELAVAVERGIPVLATAHTDSRVTRLVIGAAETNGNMTFARYNDMVADVPRLAHIALASTLQDQSEGL